MVEKRGKFIVFEGIDGSGKSSAVSALASYLIPKRFRHFLLTKEPYESQEINKILKTSESPEKNSVKLAKLFILDRKKHLDEMVRPALNMGLTVISDRYDFSTLAYQSAQGIPLEKLEQMHLQLIGKDKLIIPDLTILIDLPAEIACERGQGLEDAKDHKFDGKLEFQKKLRREYLRISKKYLSLGREIKIINGAESRQEVAEAVVNAYKESLEK